MTRARTLLLTALAMLAFAGNSLLCRMALATTTIDPASFTAIRIVAGALALAMIVRLRHAGTPLGDWPSGIALFVYAAAFSFAYVTLPAAAGALLLFGSVQATMIGHGLASGERPGVRQLVGLAVAFAGLVGLLLPGLSAPPLQGSLLMIAAGAAWGIYSLRGRSGGDATRETAGNFLRAAVLAGGLGLLMLPVASVDRAGVLYAVASGALASGVGYAVWYTALRGLAATSAASVQLSVPVIAAVGGILLLGEALTLRLVLCSTAVLGGIGLVIAAGQRRARDARRGRPG